MTKPVCWELRNSAGNRLPPETATSVSRVFRQHSGVWTRAPAHLRNVKEGSSAAHFTVTKQGEKKQ